MGVGGAGGYLDALSSQVLDSINADAGLDGGFVAFVGVALGDGGALGAEAVVISDVAEVALACDSVVGLIGSALSAGSKDPEVPIIAVTLTIFKISVDSTVLVVGASSIDDLISGIADAAARLVVRVGVEGTEKGRDALSVVEGKSVVALALSVDVGLV